MGHHAVATSFKAAGNDCMVQWVTSTYLSALRRHTASTDSANARTCASSVVMGKWIIMA